VLAIDDRGQVRADRFKDAMSRLAASVCVATVDNGVEGRAVTIASLISLSLDPPLIAFALSNESRTRALLRDGAQVGISVLQAGQRDVAVRYASRDRRGERLADAGLHRWSGVWVVEGSNAWLASRMIEQVNVGDHTLYVLAVDSASSHGGAPLVYLDRSYGVACAVPDPVEAREGLTIKPSSW
jgi:flavin reductase (DIM6/NTAB) family NADH-FMN oxidoreductase RutF